MVAAVSKTGLDALELRLQRLDAKVKVSPGQLGLDFSAPAASPPRAAAKSGGGEKCGGGWIDPKKTCRKGEGGQAGQSQQEEEAAKPYRPTPQINEPLTVKPMVSGDIEYDVTAERVKNKGASKFWRSVRNGRPAYFHYFRDRKAVEHWMAEDNAQADADAEVGSGKRRSKEWQAEFRQSYSDHRRMYADTSDYDLLESADRWVSAGKATRGGTMIDVRIGGNKHSRPIRAGFFDPKEKAGGEVEPAASDPVLTNPSRIDPGLAPKAKQPGINAQDVTTTAQQAQLARQQRQAAAAAGDQAGAKAWQEAERKAERDRLQMAMNRGQQQQASLFGVTEYDETMPLFQRRDSVDPVAQLVSKILRDQLPGAEVLDWSRQPRGITAGRAVSEGLVYRFRCDSDTIGYQPAWDGIDERQWEHRSEGFLMARDPSMRLDYRRGGGVKFQQAKTKRQCSKGYGCGSACISMNKECRVQPSSAISKVRLKQLQALAQEGDAKAAAQAQELQMQRDAKAQGLQRGRQTAKLQKLLEDPRVAEMVRTGKIPEAGAAGGEPMAGQVRNVKPSDVEVDPERFQYKIGSSATGEVGSLSGVQRWDPNLAGVVSVWQDPADGKTYVVNGHNRLALARRLGAEEVTVRYLKAEDAQEARAIGAMQNIAEGAGTEIDAGKFFRDSGVKTIEEVKAKGLPLNSGKAERGLALAQLPDEMFQDVVQGNLKVRRAAVIGASGLDQDKQREVYKMLKARPSMTDETLAEYVEHLAVSTRQSQTEIDLFGANETSVDTGLARAELANGLKKALGREARLLGAVSKTQQAKELLEQKGGNVINVEQSQQQANEASSVLRTFDQLKNLSGPIRTALDQAAARVTAGENRNKVARELREAVVQAMEEELRNAGLKPDEPPRDELTMNLFDSADRFDALEARIDALKRKCNTGYSCGSACISPAKECRSEGGSASKQRAQRLEEIARGGKAGRGIGQLRGEAAAAKAAEIRGARSERAAQLRQQRAQQRRGGALAVGGGQPGAIDVEVVSSSNSRPEPARPSGGKPGGLADTMRQSLNAMKAADARQMGMVAEQLFETEWIIERRGRYRGMSKDQAREAYKAEFAKKLQEADQARQAAGPSDAARRAAQAGSIAGAMRSLIEDMKASDERLQELTERTIDLRVQAEEFNEGGDEGTLGGSTSRRQLGGRRRKGRGSRRDSADDWFDSLNARLDAAKRKCTTGYGCGSTCINVKKECRSEGGAGAASKERIQRLEQLSRGEIKPRGLGVPKPAEAASMATELQGRRSSRAQALRSERQAARAAKEAETAKAAEKAQQEAAAKEVTTGRGKPRKGTPRGDADTVQGSGDYEFARDSSISNVGEDFALSARHRRNMFRTIEEAEASGQVEKILTRDNLLKNFPVDLSSNLTPGNALARLEAHFMLKAFPGKPYSESDLRTYRLGGGKTDPETLRKQYFDFFQGYRQKVTEAAEMMPPEGRRMVNGWVREQIDVIRGRGPGRFAEATDAFNPVANSIVNLQNRLVKVRTSTSVQGQMEQVAKAVKDEMVKKAGGPIEEMVTYRRPNGEEIQMKRLSDPPLDAKETLSRTAEIAQRLIEGASFNDAFGKDGNGKRRFNSADLYVAPAMRTGGRSVGGTAEAASESIMARSGFRGIQYGNSVTDEERRHHVQKAAEAMVDLADVLQFPDSAIGLNGTLGLAIGARGRGSAMAHYEPDLKVINLTRKNGVGTLAHEWGHALDNYASAGGKSFLTHSSGNPEHRAAMGAVISAWDSSGFTKQVYAAIKAMKGGGLAISADYWTSREEMFARSFEAYTQLKLDKAGRKNTYLTQATGDPLWPTRKQAEEMEPMFDALMAKLRQDLFPGPTNRRDSRDERIWRFMHALVS